MDVLPAIDLRDGQCVRLVQGQYHRQITYHDDPVKQAEDFIEAGSEWLHIVDLDGAKLGRLVNIEAIKALAAVGRLKIEVGGGVRDESAIKQLLDLGIERVIIGTKAVEDFDWFEKIAEKFNRRIVISLDARGSKVSTDGWTKDQPQLLLDFAIKAAKLPLAAIIYTDIARDGMMTGPNLEKTKALVDAVSVPVVCAGGVNTVDDIKQLAGLGVSGAIIGRALYEGTLDLAQAIKAAQKP
ncbi:MAG: 1-(5-phosphoribosyl)-5-[(5-phosphoribosylamino)methylideneamino]imidazole-4-carboxamide isomerase [Phycisphaerae bacterium]